MIRACWLFVIFILSFVLLLSHLVVSLFLLSLSLVVAFCVGASFSFLASSVFVEE